MLATVEQLARQKLSIPVVLGSNQQRRLSAFYYVLSATQQKRKLYKNCILYASRRKYCLFSVFFFFLQSHDG